MGDVNIKPARLLTKKGLGIIYTAISNSDPDRHHICVYSTTDHEWMCSCYGFQFGNECWHIKEAKKLLIESRGTRHIPAEETEAPNGNGS